MAKTVGSNFLLTDRRLSASFKKGGFDALSAEAGAESATFRPLSSLYWLLEPDSFFKGKGRKPFATQPERAHLWAESGLVNGVILLPDQDQDTSPTRHYQIIHESIAPALWLTTGENSAMIEILKRGSNNGIDIGTIVPRTITPHASFLAETKSMGRDDAKEELFEHIALLYRQKFGETFARFSAQAHFAIIEAITDGLTEGL